MNVQEVAGWVIDYAKEHGCSIDESIKDLEFDGPNGSFGPDEDLLEELDVYFTKLADEGDNYARENYGEWLYCQKGDR